MHFLKSKRKFLFVFLTSWLTVTIYYVLVILSAMIFHIKYENMDIRLKMLIWFIPISLIYYFLIKFLFYKEFKMHNLSLSNHNLYLINYIHLGLIGYALFGTMEFDYMIIFITLVGYFEFYKRTYDLEKEKS